MVSRNFSSDIDLVMIGSEGIAASTHVQRCGTRREVEELVQEFLMHGATSLSHTIRVERDTWLESIDANDTAATAVRLCLSSSTKFAKTRIRDIELNHV